MKLTPSLIFLVIANLVPLLGVLFWGWQVYAIMLLFWVENIIIGVMNVVRIIYAAGDSGKNAKLKNRLGAALFFSFHYGFFTFVHGAFVFNLFLEPAFPEIDYQFLTVISLLSENQLYWAVLALSVSHLVSLVLNYLLAGEYRMAKVKIMMEQPYRRVVILHITIIVGAFLLQQLNEPLAGVIVLIAIKIGMDIRAHQKEHSRISGQDIMASQTIFHRLFKSHKAEEN